MCVYILITGDTADNIPGLKGVGPKIAAALISHFNTIENLYSMLAPISSNDEDNNSDNDEIDSAASIAVISKLDIDVDIVDTKKKKSKKSRLKIPEEDVLILKEIEIATKNVRCNPSKILASMREASLQEVLMYRELSKLKNNLQNLEIVQPNDEFYFVPLLDENEEVNSVKRRLIEERENRENEGLQLKEISSQHFRYIGESRRAEEFFEEFGAGIFSKALLLIRTQYNKLDISIKANGERGAAEADDGNGSLNGVW